ncbi:hypothetical protein N7520_003924 [Penicillium odoratum]|uniref:uncharacterized protein n=1 Tax=Penicillium odoratum TaxID=1167516 RepID=UPI002546E0C9|nr:uncharacterized protein N7520_003924 [Penicillium odoratum]KAJ5769365.1 hypothetical protein N7520_003924 [Penicillium odoratum]
MATTDEAQKRPNFLFILADDLGFSDIGCFGSEIQTPHIDALAADGIRMLNHHTAAACSPTRAMLMSGTDAHLGGLGCLIESRNSPQGGKRWNGKAGYEGYLNNDVATLPEILGDNGYFTAISGKWHLGLRASQGPTERGFQKAFALLPGCCNHYAWEPVQERFPMSGSPIHTEGGVKADIQPNKTADPEGFYTTDFYTDKLINYLDDRSEDEKAKPFFAFLPYTAPHWPLQCSKALRDKYKGMYDDGPYALRERRLKKLVEIGIIDESVVPHKVETSTQDSGEWDEFTPEERRCSSRSMETYAGMVNSMDDNVGKVIAHLKKTGEYDNTFIVFMSDNGAEGAAWEARPVMGDNIKRAIHKYYDNSYENIGNYNSFTWLGPLWAQASTAPSRLFKGFPSQGGILVPCVVKPPTNTFLPFTPGSFNRSFSTVMDWSPTFLELAGISLPQPFEKEKLLSPEKTTVLQKWTKFRGRDVHAIRGKSWVPFFAHGKKAEDEELWHIHPSTEPIGWELFARAAMRKGDWKIVHIGKANGGKGENNGDGWELFNVVEDPGENVDLTASHPEKYAELLACWEDYVNECGIVWGQNAMDPGLSKEEAPELWQDEIELQKAWLGAKAGDRVE